MKIMVGYHGEEVGRQALLEARDFAKATGSYVYIVTSMEGGDSETPSEIREAEAGLQFAAGIMKKSGVAFETVKSVRGFSPGEDLVKFAEEHDIDHIFVGLKKISRTHKALLGSTARFVILKAHCPVTSVKFELEKINNFKLLKERRVLVVDDEPDIVETVEELLDMCHLDTAGTYTEAEKLISKNLYDIAILDIMGVSGYDILAMARDRDIPAVILTAHALTPHNLKEIHRKRRGFLHPQR